MSQPPDVGALLQGAHDEGLLSAVGLQALTLLDVGAQIQAGLGIAAIDVQASEVVLVTVMPDDSGSIGMTGKNAQLVRDGHNGVLDTLLATKQKDSILFHTRYLNGHVLNPYRPLEHVVRMDKRNFDPRLGTPLYDQTAVLLGTVLAKAQEFAENGVPVRTVTLLVTDGADCHSTRADAAEVAALVRDLLQAETHIVGAMGIDDGQTDFRAVFRAMGIRDEWIFTRANDPAEIRRGFQLFSQSAVRASQSAVFSQTALGGFGG